MIKSYIGLDVGGTKVLGGLFDKDGKLLKEAKRATKASKGSEIILKQIFRVIDELMMSSDSEVLAIGAGVPGIIENGNILFTPNLPWNNYPLKKELEEHYGIPVTLGNDATTSLLGEWKYGSAKGAKNVVGIFVGTGIGGGILIGGSPYMGSIGAAGELGHMIVSPEGPYCGCGARGCLESVASKTAIQKKITNQISRGRKTILENYFKENYILKSSQLKEALESNDELVVEVIDELSYYLGVGAASIMNIFNPDVIVFGGGLINALSNIILPKIIKTAHSYAIARIFEHCEIKEAMLGDHACLYGSLVILEEVIS